MWIVNETDLQMVRDDYGLSLPITIVGKNSTLTLTSDDTIYFAIKSLNTQEVLIERFMQPNDNNTVNFTLTEEESSRLKVGTYAYVLDWYQNGNFMCNIIRAGIFKVVDKK